jgi:hypothetical protein
MIEETRYAPDKQIGKCMTCTRPILASHAFHARGTVQSRKDTFGYSAALIQCDQCALHAAMKLTTAPQA